MQHIESTGDAMVLSQHLINRGIIYCEDCQKDIAAQMVGYHYGLN